MSRQPVIAAALVVLLTLVTISVSSASSKTPPGQSSPINVSQPSLSGTPTVGSTLQASSGTWKGRGLTYSFQWQRCNTASSCAAISGATGSSYPAASADVGDTLRVSVTATNQYGSATATSAQTTVVSAAPPTGYTNTAVPAVSGTPQVGQTLSASNGSWSPTPSSYQYAWARCQNGSCSPSPTSSSSTSYVVQSADIGYTIVAQVAPAGAWSNSANSKPTAAVTGSTSSGGTVAFDGSASKMTQLSRTGSSDPGTQSPSIWSCLCFINNDISLAADSTFGKRFDVGVATGDSNGYGGTDPSYGAAQLSIRRTNDLGKWDYFAGAVKVNSWNGPIGDLFFADIWSLGYQTSESDQVALGLWNGPSNNGPLMWSISSNAGNINAPSSWQPGSTNYQDEVKPVTLGQWEEFVVGVKWATDKTGEVQVYNRQPGGSWVKVYDKANVDTYLYGTTQTGTFAQDGSNWPTVIDKVGLYFKEYGGESEAVQESGLTRSSDLATAESTLP